MGTRQDRDNILWREFRGNVNPDRIEGEFGNLAPGCRNATDLGESSLRVQTARRCDDEESIYGGAASHFGVTYATLAAGTFEGMWKAK